jgi:hypothetical protein
VGGVPWLNPAGLSPKDQKKKKFFGSPAKKRKNEFLFYFIFFPSLAAQNK